MNRTRPALRRLARLATPLLALSLIACSAGPRRFTSADGVVVEPSAKWSQLESKHYGELYEDPDFDPSDIDMALAREFGESGYFVIQRLPAENNRTEMMAFLDELRTSAIADREATVAELEKLGYTERELQLFEPLLNGIEVAGDELRYLLQELYLQSLLYSFAEHDAETYQELGIEDLDVGQRRVQFASYSYLNQQGTELREMVAYLVGDTTIYMLSRGRTANPSAPSVRTTSTCSGACACRATPSRRRRRAATTTRPSPCVRLQRAATAEAAPCDSYAIDSTAATATTSGTASSSS